MGRKHGWGRGEHKQRWLWSKQADGGASQEGGEAKGVTSIGKMKRFLDLYDIQVEIFIMALPGDSVPVLNLAALAHSLPQAHGPINLSRA